MASSLYDSGRQAFGRGEIVWKASGGSDIRAILIDTADYTVDLSTHDNLDDIPGAARVSVSAALTLIDCSGGVCDANDGLFSAVSGDISEAIVLYKHTGTESTSTLIAYIDSGTGLPVTPNGSDIIIQWDDGANKIFKI